MSVLITGGAGSLGKVLTSKFLSLGYDVFAFSTDEEKHIKYEREFPKAKHIIGDVKDIAAIKRAVYSINPDIVIIAHAKKCVPEMEEFPMEAVKVNVLGTENVLNVCDEFSLYKNKKIKVLSVSTDKACLPINSYGMSKALQERITLRYNKDTLATSCVRYGNVLNSRNSVIPFFKEKIGRNENLTVTDRRMRRFFLSLDESVSLILRALEDIHGGKVFVPKIKSSYILNLAEILIEESGKDLHIDVTGIRPGEKGDECLVSEEEMFRTEELEDVLVIHDIMKKNSEYNKGKFLKNYREYSSANSSIQMDKEELRKFLKERNIV